MHTRKKTELILIHRRDNHLVELKKALEHYSYTILAETDSEKGFEQIKSEVPDAILAESTLAEVDGIHLCWLIRQTKDIALTPFILLTDTVNSEERINALRSGVDACIDRETSIREIHTLIETLTKKVEQIRSCAHSMRGKIPDFSSVELMQMLHNARKSGMLIIYDGKTTGEIGFSGGNMVWAVCGDKYGEEAVVELSSMQSGTFHFEIDSVPSNENIDTPTMQLILNCCKILDEQNDAYRTGHM
ncbi:MAG: DUF4388 domain-containing protein [candidate division KSB1 bacterium]|jgi:DNA-binding NarL/FixJ family response regulator|nr:DUF4388 domain-containing protein [candidate division KSB1 bacterium]